jgi:Fic-DOC domain mobile mystery protein B
MKTSETNGTTPLSDDEKQGLLPSHITLREELYEFEETNILEAVNWALSRKIPLENLFSHKFICQLHKKMFGNVWAWAGKFRQSNKNLGIPWYHINDAVKQLLDDTLFRIENKSFSTDETAMRFHHRLVQIHPFPNGNGRHARILTDLLLSCLGHDKFTWGSSANLVKKGKFREKYIQALQAADKGDFKQLLKFVRA